MKEEQNYTAKKEQQQERNVVARSGEIEWKNIKSG